MARATAPHPRLGTFDRITLGRATARYEHALMLLINIALPITFFDKLGLPRLAA